MSSIELIVFSHLRERFDLRAITLHLGFHPASLTCGGNFLVSSNNVRGKIPSFLLFEWAGGVRTSTMADKISCLAIVQAPMRNSAYRLEKLHLVLVRVRSSQMNRFLPITVLGRMNESLRAYRRIFAFPVVLPDDPMRSVRVPITKRNGVHIGVGRVTSWRGINSFMAIECWKSQLWSL